MVENNNKLSKWDETWLSDKNEEKYEYAFEYIRTRWPLEVTQNMPLNWSGSKRNSVRNLFCKLIQEGQFDTRGIIRRTKEAWRSYEKNSLKRNSGNYTNVKLTDLDKNKMRVLAKEAGLSSVSEVVSSILSNEYKELLANKKLERIDAKSKATVKEQRAQTLKEKEALLEDVAVLKSELARKEKEIESLKTQIKSEQNILSPKEANLDDLAQLFEANIPDRSSN
jgi:hypothetical protein